MDIALVLDPVQRQFLDDLAAVPQCSAEAAGAAVSTPVLMSAGPLPRRGASRSVGVQAARCRRGRSSRRSLFAVGVALAGHGPTGPRGGTGQAASSLRSKLKMHTPSKPVDLNRKVFFMVSPGGCRWVNGTGKAQEARLAVASRSAATRPSSSRRN